MADAPQSLLPRDISENEAQLLAGNCFSMSAMGQWMMYVLASAELACGPKPWRLQSDNGQRSRTRVLGAGSSAESALSIHDSMSEVGLAQPVEP